MTPSRQTIRFALSLSLALFVASSAKAAEALPFTVVLLPDTQLYCESFPDTYVTQTRWIRDQAKKENIKFVIHLGDIVQNPDSEEEWKVADRAHQVLDGVIPYSMLPGNHDMIETDTTLYNKYFPPRRFAKQPWYGGQLDDKNDNNFCLFEAGGLKFMVLSLQFAPGDEQIDWASRIIQGHPTRRVVLATHDYLMPDNRRSETGERLWQRLVRNHPAVFMVVSGHRSVVGLKTSTNDAGGRVHEILTDYQALPNGGNGWLRLLRFVPGENKIHIRAYSPLLDENHKHPAHTYTLDYDMNSEILKKAG